MLLRFIGEWWVRSDPILYFSVISWPSKRHLTLTEWHPHIFTSALITSITLYSQPPPPPRPPPQKKNRDRLLSPDRWRFAYLPVRSVDFYNVFVWLRNLAWHDRSCDWSWNSYPAIQNAKTPLITAHIRGLYQNQSNFRLMLSRNLYQTIHPSKH